jgi:hypothetical protein
MANKNKFLGLALFLAVLVAGCGAIGTAEKKAPEPAVAASVPRPPVAIMIPEGVKPPAQDNEPQFWSHSYGATPPVSPVVRRKAVPPAPGTALVSRPQAQSSVNKDDDLVPTVPSVVLAPPQVAVVPPKNGVSTLGPASWGGLGYDGNLLVRSPWFGKKTTVDMRVQQFPLAFECSRRLATLPSSASKHAVTVIVWVAASPSAMWEPQFDHLVAKHANDAGNVTALEVKKGVTQSVGQWHEALCGEVNKLPDESLSLGSSLDVAGKLSSWINQDHSAWSVQVHTTKYELSDEVKDSLALIGLQQLKKAGRKS